MKIGDRIRRTLPRGDVDIKTIETQTQLEYYRTLSPEVKIEILPEISDSVCLACEG